MAPTKRLPAGLLQRDIDELFAGAEDWDLEDDYIPSPKKPSAKKTLVARSKSYESEPYTRCVVDAVSEIELGSRWLKQLDVHVDKADMRVVSLQDDWYDTDVRPGDIVNAIGSFSVPATGKPSMTITSQNNLLILHPDILLTATALSNAPQCARKPLLSSLVRASNDISPALVWGNMLHEVMQNCMLEKRWEKTWINDKIDEVILNGLGMLLALNVSVETARTELRKRAIGFGTFKDRYIADVPKPDAVLSDTRARANDNDLLLAIPQLHEIEEDIWSPKYGLKGKIDATVEAVMTEKPIVDMKSTAMNNYLSPPTATLTSGPRPFEIKTGLSLAGLEHRAQTMLYTLLTSERYGTDVPDGLLYYTQSDSVVRVPRSRNELRGLMVARNQLAGYMIKRLGREVEAGKRREENTEPEKDIEEIGMGAETFLPAPIDSEYACKKCYALDTCMLYRYAYSAGPSTSKLPALEVPPSPSKSPSSLYDAYQLKTGHLTPERGLFFRNWETLLSLEERDLVRFRRELWTIGAEDREKKGRCFAGMIVKPKCKKGEDQYAKDGKNLAGSSIAGEGKEYKFSYTFVRSEQSPHATSSPEVDQRNLMNGHISIGDPVTLSVEPHLLAFAQGYVTHLTPGEVKLGVDHRVDLEWIRARMLQDATHAKGEEEEVIFRIDKDELFGGMGRMRNNLAQLFYANGDRKRLELVVDLRKPLFSSPSLSTPDSPYTKLLNKSQKQAITKVLSVEDYALILGMPGTGKTMVVAALIKILVDQGKTVLLTSYTHSAVDTILRKLDEETAAGHDSEGSGLSFGVLRLGNLEKIHPDVRKYTLDARKKAVTVEQMEAQWMRPPVVAATCLSVEHPLFNRRKFDYCIVDEASQITLPTCLGPLRYADKFILVGDHFQLPPLVKNSLARRGGLDVSLFRRLSDAHPESVIDLREQYRMNEDIMALSNKLIYNEKLKCGSEEVAKRKLALPNASAESKRDWLEVCHRRRRALQVEGNADLCPGVNDRNRCWLSYLASPDTTAVFVDTDTLGYGVAHDSRVGALVQNEMEAELVVQLVEALVEKWGVVKKDVGVISLYRQQVKLIKGLLADRARVSEEDGAGVEEEVVEVLTADKSQGRDKECIVVSMVRSNDQCKIGDLVKDWRRINVSFTRARSKLVIFGSRRTLKTDTLLSQFFDLMEGRGWVYELPRNAHLVHKADLDSDLVDEGVDDNGVDEGIYSAEDEQVVTQEVGAEDMTLCVDVEEDLEATLVAPTPTPKDVGKLDDDDVEVVDVFFSDARPEKSMTSKSVKDEGKRKKTKAGRMVRNEEKDGNIMIVDSRPTTLPAKRESGVMKNPETSSSTPKRKLASTASVKRPEKENIADRRGGMGPPDKYFLTAPSAKAGTKRNAVGEGKSERPKKKVKVGAEKKQTGMSAGEKKACALLKGRPILLELAGGDR